MSVREPLGLGTGDIEDEWPMTDFSQIMAKRLRPQSWNHRHVYIAQQATVDRLYHIWATIFTLYPILRSFIIEVDGAPSYVVLKPSKQLFKRLISHHPAISTRKKFNSILWNDEERDFASAPGPMCRVVIAALDEGHTAGFLLSVSHAVFDAVSIMHWLRDIDMLIGGKKDEDVAARPQVPYKQWVESYVSHRDGPTAASHCEYHARQLKGIGRLEKALWPRAKAPEMFKGYDRHWQHRDGRPGLEHERIPLDGAASSGTTGLVKRRKIHGLATLQSRYGIGPPIVFKAACALLNMRLTNHKQALFASYHAAKAWPFIEDWASESERKELPSPLLVTGPTLEIIINRIQVQAGETVGALLTRLRREEKSLTEHAQAPFFKLQDTLRAQEVDGESDAKMLYEIMRRQIYNWLGTHITAPHFDNMVQSQRVSRSDVGMLWNCGIIRGDDKQTVTINATWDDAQLRAKEVQKATDTFFELAQWLANPDHWSSRLGHLPENHPGSHL